MALGKYRHHLLVQRRVPTSDGQGGHIMSWRDVGTFPCRIKTLSLRERNRYDTFNIDVTHRVELRDSGDDGDVIDEHMRAIDVTNDAAGTMFDIISVQDIEKRDRFLEVMLRETSAKKQRKQNR